MSYRRVLITAALGAAAIVITATGATTGWFRGASDSHHTSSSATKQWSVSPVNQLGGVGTDRPPTVGRDVIEQSERLAGSPSPRPVVN